MEPFTLADLEKLAEEIGKIPAVGFATLEVAPDVWAVLRSQKPLDSFPFLQAHASGLPVVVSPMAPLGYYKLWALTPKEVRALRAVI